MSVPMAPQAVSLGTHDGLRLAATLTPAHTGTIPRGTVVLVHGLGEHRGRYAHVIESLASSGWATLAYDQRGHGDSDGPRGGLPRAADLYFDLAGVVDRARADRPRRLVLLGHSLGGAVAARFAAEALSMPGLPRLAWSRPIDALVVSSPALRLNLKPWQRAVVSTLHAVAGNLTVANGLAASDLSHSAEVVQAYLDDPKVHRQVSLRLLQCMVDAGTVVADRPAYWSIPTLVMWAGADRIVDPLGSVDFVDRAPSGFVTGHCFGPLYHEIFNEPGHPEVMDTLQQWLTKL